MRKTGKFKCISTGIKPDIYKVIWDPEESSYSVSNGFSVIYTGLKSISEVKKAVFVVPHLFTVEWDLELEVGKSYLTSDGTRCNIIRKDLDNWFIDRKGNRYSKNGTSIDIGLNLVEELFTIKVTFPVKVEYAKSYELTDGSTVYIDKLLYDKFSSHSTTYIWNEDGYCNNGPNIMKEYQLELELGKSYYDRQGNVHLICGIIDDNKFTNYHSDHVWNKNGKNVFSEHEQCRTDLVLEVPYQNQVKVIPNKPALGLSPKFNWKSPRVKEIKEAINRKIDNDEKIPVKWIEEYNKILDV
jgi:hypothetical protein